MNDTPIRSPLSERHMPEAAREALRALLIEHVALSAPATSRRPRKRVLIPAVVGGIALIGVGGGAAYGAIAGSGPVTDQHTARCYTTASYSSNVEFPGTTVGVPDSASEPGAVTNALDACRTLWRAGILQPGARTAIVRPAQAQYPVPGLVECVLPDGLMSSRAITALVRPRASRPRTASSRWLSLDSSEGRGPIRAALSAVTERVSRILVEDDASCEDGANGLNQQTRIGVCAQIAADADAENGHCVGERWRGEYEDGRRVARCREVMQQLRGSG